MSVMISRLYNFQARTPAVADQVDAEFNQLIEAFNSFIGMSGTGTSQATVAVDTDTYGEWVIDDLDQGVTFNEPTGDVWDGKALRIALRDDGTSRSITFNSTYFKWITTTVSATVANKWVYFGLVYREADLKWHIVAARQEP
jgi:hypothetical protein